MQVARCICTATKTTFGPRQWAVVFPLNCLRQHLHTHLNKIASDSCRNVCITQGCSQNLQKRRADVPHETAAPCAFLGVSGVTMHTSRTCAMFGPVRSTGLAQTKRQKQCWVFSVLYTAVGQTHFLQSRIEQPLPRRIATPSPRCHHFTCVATMHTVAENISFFYVCNVTDQSSLLRCTHRDRVGREIILVWTNSRQSRCAVRRRLNENDSVCWRVFTRHRMEQQVAGEHSLYFTGTGRPAFRTNKVCDNCQTRIMDRTFYHCSENCDIDFCEDCYLRLVELFEVFFENSEEALTGCTRPLTLPTFL